MGIYRETIYFLSLPVDEKVKMAEKSCSPAVIDVDKIQRVGADEYLTLYTLMCNLLNLGYYPDDDDSEGESDT